MTSTPVSQVHPELFHYTGVEGLFAILDSQYLRATHFQFLNDTRELQHFSELLPRLIQPELVRRATELATVNDEARRFLEKNGGPETVCTEEAMDLAKSMCEVLLNTAPAGHLFEFYVTSFCTPDTENELTREHGLLSQWRYYGENGGYALVFDTLELEKLIGQEHAQWGGRLSLGEVGYSHESIDALTAKVDDIPKLLEAFDKCYFRSPEECTPLLEPLMSCCIHYKHWAFAEEREIRLTATLNSPLMHQEHIKAGMPVNERERRVFKRSDEAEVPHVRLFEGLPGATRCLLPIKSIIVGPGPTQAEREERLTTYLHQKSYPISVTRSNIPIRF